MELREREKAKRGEGEDRKRQSGRKIGERQREQGRFEGKKAVCYRREEKENKGVGKS